MSFLDILQYIYKKTLKQSRCKLHHFGKATSHTVLNIEKNMMVYHIYHLSLSCAEEANLTIIRIIHFTFEINNNFRTSMNLKFTYCSYVRYRFAVWYMKMKFNKVTIQLCLYLLLQSLSSTQVIDPRLHVLKYLKDCIKTVVQRNVNGVKRIAS
jgi:hypothetical protein